MDSKTKIRKKSKNPKPAISSSDSESGGDNVKIKRTKSCSKKKLHSKRKHKKIRKRSSSSDSSSSQDSSTSSTTSSSTSEERKRKKTKKQKKKTEDGPSNDIPLELMGGDRSMAPMTKKEWEEKQDVVRRVFDETTGRNRLIKGDGEVIEEIVSRDRHKQINQQATKGDGEYFQKHSKLL